MKAQLEVSELARTLKPGDYVTPDIAEKLVPKSRSDRGYSLGVLALKEKIERALEALGVTCFVKCDKDGIRLLDYGVEGVEYEARGKEECWRRFVKLHVKGEIAVKRDLLPPDVRQRYEHDRSRAAKLILCGQDDSE